MHAGELRELVDVLSLQNDGNAYSWAVIGFDWVKAERTDKANIFSSVGLGAKTVKFTLRKRADLTLHNAIRWGGRHCFLTDINNDDIEYSVIVAALVEPTACVATRPQKTRGERGVPVYAQEPLCRFPACVTEKWMGYVQKEPQAELGETLVLVAPKCVTLRAGDLVAVGTLGWYAVRVCHMLDAYKNEYEVLRRKEA